MHVFRYLRGTSSLRLTYGKDLDNALGLTTLLGYSDADWAGDYHDCRSTSGYIFQLGMGDQTANVLTKGLARTKHVYFTTLLGLLWPSMIHLLQTSYAMTAEWAC